MDAGKGRLKRCAKVSHLTTEFADQSWNELYQSLEVRPETNRAKKATLPQLSKSLESIMPFY